MEPAVVAYPEGVERCAGDVVRPPVLGTVRLGSVGGLGCVGGVRYGGGDFPACVRVADGGKVAGFPDLPIPCGDLVTEAHPRRTNQHFNAILSRGGLNQHTEPGNRGQRQRRHTP